MLALKLLLVPAFLALLTFAGKRWGPRVAGLLTGLPIVTAPILLLLSLERGVSFASQATGASLSAASAAIAFNLVYAWAATRSGWLPSLSAGLLAWVAAVILLAQLPASVPVALAASLLALFLAPRFFPRVSPATQTQLPKYELLFRMAAGALITVLVTGMAANVGPVWSGIASVFPTLGTVLAVFSHRANGSSYVVVLLRAITLGLSSLIAFCLVLALLLPDGGIAMSFGAALACALAVQWIASRVARRSRA